MTYSPEQRAQAIDTVIAGLSKGTPLTVLCSAEGMPGVSTFYEWMDADGQLSGAIARARELGFDAIAAEGLEIVDDLTEDPASRRVRSDYRLKLLAKWDPKRYGDKQLVGSDPDNPLPAGAVIAVGATMEEAAEAYRRLIQG